MLMSCCSMWKWIVNNAAAISALAAVIAVFVTIWSLHTNRRFESSKMRPIIAIEIANISNVYNLIVRNIGLTAAYDVKINVSPSIKINLSPTISGDIPFLKHPIPHLQAGCELRSAFITGYDSLKKISNELRFSFDVEYVDSYGKRFSEKQKLDVRLIEDSAVLKEAGFKDIVAGIDKVEKAIREIAKRE